MSSEDTAAFSAGALVAAIVGWVLAIILFFNYAGLTVECGLAKTQRDRCYGYIQALRRLSVVNEDGKPVELKDVIRDPDAVKDAE